MSFFGLEGKRFLISGVSNKKSVASFCAQLLVDEGADLVFLVQYPEQASFVEKKFPDITIPPVHVDLRFLAKRVGYKGGQKSIEKQIFNFLI